MKKLYDLYNFLKLSGFNSELKILKIALETTPEELESAFPSLFRFYEEGRPTAMFGGIFAQINKYIEEGYISQQEIDSIGTFDSLKQKMKELKDLKKETEDKFKYLNQYNIEQESKELAKEKRLSEEDFKFVYKSFITKDQDNHELNQAIAAIADLREKYRMLEDKIPTIQNNEDLLSRLSDPLSYKTLDNASTEINNLMMHVNNIIEGRQSSNLKNKLLNYYDYIYNGENKLNAEYPKERMGKAKRTSEILYNDGDWAIVHSWSEEACQYWERGAVKIEENKVNFKTCTSRIGGVHNLTNDNLYRDYVEFTVIQILKLENGKPKFYEGPNEMFAVCFKFNNKFEMLEGGTASVNADNKDINKSYLSNYLPKNIYYKLMNILNTEKGYRFISFEQLLNSKLSTKVKKNLMFNAVSKLNSDDFFKNKYKISKDIFNSLEKEKVKDLSPQYYFDLSLDKKYPEILEKKLEEIKGVFYFNLSLDKKYPRVLEKKLEDISSRFYFDLKLYKKYPRILRRKLEDAPSRYYFDLNLDKEYPEMLEKKLKDAPGRYYFDLKLNGKWERKHPEMLEEKLEEIKAEYYFLLKLDEKYPEVLEKKLEDISSDYYFDLKLDEKYPEVLEQKLKNVQ